MICLLIKVLCQTKINCLPDAVKFASFDEFDTQFHVKVLGSPGELALVADSPGV